MPQRFIIAALLATYWGVSALVYWTVYRDNEDPSVKRSAKWSYIVYGLASAVAAVVAIESLAHR